MNHVKKLKKFNFCFRKLTNSLLLLAQIFHQIGKKSILSMKNIELDDFVKKTLCT